MLLCPKCEHLAERHPVNEEGNFYCSFSLVELPSCYDCRADHFALDAQVICTVEFNHPSQHGDVGPDIFAKGFVTDRSWAWYLYSPQLEGPVFKGDDIIEELARRLRKSIKW